MSIEFVCNDCDKTFSVNEGLAGSLFRCSSCGNSFRVPSQSTLQVERQERDATAAFAERTSAASPSGVDSSFPQGKVPPSLRQPNLAKWCCLSGAAAVAVLFVGSSLVLLDRRRSETVAVSTSSELASATDLGQAEERVREGEIQAAGSRSSATARARRSKSSSFLKKSEHVEPADPFRKTGSASSGEGDLERLEDDSTRVVHRSGRESKKTPLANQPSLIQQDHRHSEVLSRWDLKADPIQDGVRFARQDLKIPLPESSTVIFPQQLSRYAMLVIQQKQQNVRVLIDLQTGKNSKMLEIKIPIHGHGKLATDGRFFVAELAGPSAPDRQPPLQETNTLTWGVWDFQKRKLSQRIEILKSSDAGRVAFLGHNELLTMERVESDLLNVSVFNLLSGDRLRTFQIPCTGLSKNTHRLIWTVSPGGKYGVFVVGDQLSVVDLKEGQLLGVAPIPTTVLPCEGITFSSAGTQLAAVFGRGQAARVVNWDFMTGRQIFSHVDHANPAGEGHYQPEVTGLTQRGQATLFRAIQFDPDGKALFFGGNRFVQADTGKSIGIFQEQEGEQPLCLIDDGRLLLIGADIRRKNANSLLTRAWSFDNFTP